VRKDFIAARVAELCPKDSTRSNVVGIYRLVMKAGADNFRNSSVLGVIERLKSKGINVVIYDPIIKTDYFCSLPVINDLRIFKDICNLIVANRITPDIEDISEKVFSRDLFRED
jgi:UDPglucose 6-dehydrogenase